MNFAESTQYLYSLGNEVSAMKLGLENIRTLLNALDNPENNYLKVQVAGTNGKGSVCAFLDSICNTAGIKTGTFTSPHLISITERIRINGVDISENDFARHASVVRETAERLLENGELEYRSTFFEQITAIALGAFAETKVEVAILETGLGGRLDATTAANAEIVAITRIDLDHQEYLGETIAEIAAEKAAIITAETQDVVLGEQSPEVMAILRDRCRAFGIESINDQYPTWSISPTDGEMVNLDLPRRFPPIRLGISGRHQIENAQTAIQVVLALYYHGAFPDLEDAEEEVFVAKGLQNARHQGRLEYNGKYLFDGAHNINGAKALAEYLDEFEERPITMVFGAMNDKSVDEILAILAPLATRIIVTEPSNSRSLSYKELLDQLPPEITKERTFATDKVANAIDIANEITPEDGLILVTGSLYLVGEVKKIIKDNSPI